MLGSNWFMLTFTFFFYCMEKPWSITQMWLIVILDYYQGYVVSITKKYHVFKKKNHE